jgi:hypothetical protein
MPLNDPCDEGIRLAQEAATRHLPVKLLGGVAVFVRCPSAKLPALSRTYGDVDVISLSSERRKITGFLEEMGYQPDKLFNALHGATRLNFMDVDRERPLDVLLDRFVMCHTIDFRHRLELEPLTIPLVDLLLTKLQVVRINSKDHKDLIALLADHPLGGTAGDSIDVGRMTSLLGTDWGFEHTVRQNLVGVRSSLRDLELPPGMADAVSERIASILSALDTGRKSLRWKSRAIVGERVRWYELPEDVRH